MKNDAPIQPEPGRQFIEKKVSASRMLFENGDFYRKSPSPPSSLHAGEFRRLRTATGALPLDPANF